MKGIFVRGKKITTPAVVSTICGHWGTGMMPLAFDPRYLKFMELVRETGTTELVKSSTYRNRWGNFVWWLPSTWKYVQRIGQGSLLNAYSHTNLGVRFNAMMIGWARKMGFNPILNFAPDFSKSCLEIIVEVFYAIKQGEKWLGRDFIAIEIVCSCGNRSYKIEENIEKVSTLIKAVKKKRPNLVIIIKKGFDHPTEAVIEWEIAGMDVLHGINAVRFKAIFPGQTSPLKNVGGGTFSGRIIREIALRDNYESRKAISVPMIFGGGIESVQDALVCSDYGADAVLICTAARLNLKEAEKMIKTFNG